jgi:hypothetical protein
VALLGEHVIEHLGQILPASIINELVFVDQNPAIVSSNQLIRRAEVVDAVSGELAITMQI